MSSPIPHLKAKSVLSSCFLCIVSDVCNVTGNPSLFDGSNLTCVHLYSDQSDGEMTWVATATSACIDTNRTVQLNVTIGYNKTCEDLGKIFYTRSSFPNCANSIRLVPCKIDLSTGSESVCIMECSCPTQSESCDIYFMAGREMSDVYGLHVCDIVV